MHYSEAPDEETMQRIRDLVEMQELQTRGATWATTVAYFAAMGTMRRMVQEIMLTHPMNGMMLHETLDIFEELVCVIQSTEYHTEQNKYGPAAEQI